MHFYTGHFPHDVSMYLFLILCRHLPLSCFCLSRTDTEGVGTVFLAPYAMISFAHCDLGLEHLPLLSQVLVP